MERIQKDTNVTMRAILIDWLVEVIYGGWWYCQGDLYNPSNFHLLHPIFQGYIFQIYPCILKMLIVNIIKHSL